VPQCSQFSTHIFDVVAWTFNQVMVSGGRDVGRASSVPFHRVLRFSSSFVGAGSTSCWFGCTQACAWMRICRARPFTFVRLEQTCSTLDLDCPLSASITRFEPDLPACLALANNQPDPGQRCGRGAASACCATSDRDAARTHFMTPAPALRASTRILALQSAFAAQRRASCLDATRLPCRAVCEHADRAHRARTAVTSLRAYRHRLRRVVRRSTAVRIAQAFRALLRTAFLCILPQRALPAFARRYAGCSVFNCHSRHVGPQ